MGLLDNLIDTVGRNLIDASIEAKKEKRRQELRKNSIDVEFRVLSNEVIEKSK